MTPQTHPPPSALVTIDDAAREHGLDPTALQAFILEGDLSSVPPARRASIYVALCSYIGVDPIERPFLIFRDGKREVLYAARSCTSALCRSRGISREIVDVSIKTISGHEVVIAKARAAVSDTGRHDEATGAVPLLVRETEWVNGRKVDKGWRNPTPEEVSNAIMKAETKAKRRAVLDLVGLGIPDESEVATIRGARTGALDLQTGEIVIEGVEPAPALTLAPSKAPPADVKRLRKGVAELAKLLDKPPATIVDTLRDSLRLDARALAEHDATATAKAQLEVDRWLHRVTERGEPATSSPDHVGKIAKIMQLAKAIHDARPAEERDESIADLIGNSPEQLAACSISELASVEARLRGLYAHEVGEDAQ